MPESNDFDGDVIMEISQRVRAELDRRFAPKLAACQWEAHVPILTAQMAMIEDVILRVLERMNDEQS
jgi:hypothetical protein